MIQKNAKVVKIDSYEDVPVNNEKALQKAVAHQPVSIALEAGGRDFQHYKSVMFQFSYCPIFFSIPNVFPVKCCLLINDV